ncbi:pectin lyase-like protein [Punctularia strigosozonata HHB-11173 SS5]|uniref:Pectin lyase-like protein n=1 Tax=Punctularia strigosozonata (strain HHB-11173) TaxID=741275 RepID=R7S226_PUNST|nr:pectin lyase-like protein [Punctularia strigosozonata HHB-11173 SS5]EIN04238.1 pectin lyase-like protein [Punctularia strigosozonata HHB-11173 SS5]
MKFSTFFLGLVSLSVAIATVLDRRAVSDNQLFGYATLNGGTTGGAGGTVTTVTSLADLRSAVTGATPKIVQVSGIITGDGDTIDVGNHTTVIGLGSNSGVTGGGFRVKKGTNVIFRNLKLSKSPHPTDLIELQTSTNIWVDHNTFTSDLDHDKDFYDGQLDMNHGTDFVTVSWNIFQQHFKTSLVGGSDNTGDEDSGHLRVTYHHNWFLDVNSRTPSIRFGTGHIYNNYFDNVFDSAIDSRDGAQTLVESNVFNNVTDPIETTLNGGFSNQRNNIFQDTTLDSDLAVGTLTSVPYTYATDAASAVVAAVTASAGAAIVTSLP